MPIRFACVKCGKIHRIPDNYAGRRGTCGRCGIKFTAPGLMPAPGNVFVVADDDDIHDLNPTDGTPRDRPWNAIFFGLLVGTIVAGSIFYFVSSNRAQVPEIAMQPIPAIPMQPPVPDPAPPRLFVEDVAKTAAERITNITLSLFLWCLPIATPAILSRRGYLSVGRWLIMAGLCLFVLTLSGAIVMAMNQVDVQSVNRIVFTVVMVAIMESILGIGGCLLAAAIYPKVKK